jgi:hypothetical protein
MQKVLRIISLILVPSLTFTACGQSHMDRYKDTIQEFTRDEKSRKLMGGEGDVDDMNGCPILFEMSEWQLRKIGNEKAGNVRYIWGRDRSLIEGTMVSEGGISIDSSVKHNTKFITEQTNLNSIYIGPWHPITLTHNEGSFFNSKKITEQKQIRFFAYQKKEGGRIEYQYESMTPENKLIAEKPFSLSPSAKYAPDKFSLCVVKWTAKYGYNAVADLHKNPWFPFFSRQYLVGSGKIIDSETGKIIADKDGKFFETKE